MANKTMLIDANHPEETRVVVLNGARLEDFDVEVASRKQLKGNIYLAKVTRVEPSLQAAFVEYGGNRHGFLAFSEIHPDYYQIPVSDRQALDEDGGDEAADENPADEVEEAETVEEAPVEILGGDDDVDEIDAHRAFKSFRNYKIQEVIKRRQILLVQVVKEERGNKGAAVTTYLSLAGRYCVLMPNTIRNGGISRKIANPKDRKRLKSILDDIDLPNGMATIVRTAGAQRSKAEIRRDHDYLMRLWNDIRELTLKSTAPSLVYEEGRLIKRAIRDFYNKDIDEVIVEGDAGYRAAKDMMKKLIPSHAKKVQPYKGEGVSLFQAHKVESQLDAMHGPTVRLKSGGYVVINPTEALVAIDVNSGRATKERNIEETAYKTNLEAAEEIARQLRLRDLAGLIVIDFIDMEVARNQTQVERRLKEAMRLDRARIQIGRISPFGLLELSRQRLRPSIIETSFSVCPHCGGTGVLRTTESTALYLLRNIEEEAAQRRGHELIVHVATRVALYILNYKRSVIADIEKRCGVAISMRGDDSLTPPDHRLEQIELSDGAVVPFARSEEDSQGEPISRADKASPPAADKDDEAGPLRKRRRRPRRQRKSAEGAPESKVEAQTDGRPTASAEEAATEVTTDDSTPADVKKDGDGEEEPPRRRRRRGRRGGRRRGRSAPSADGGGMPEEKAGDITADGGAEAPLSGAEPDVAPDGGSDGEAPVGDAPLVTASAEAPKKKPVRRRRTVRKPGTSDAKTAPTLAEADQPATAEKPKSKRRTRKKATPPPADGTSEKPREQPDTAPSAVVTVISDKNSVAPKATPRKGWWQRFTD